MQFPLQVRVWPIARLVREWPRADIDLRIAIAAALGKARARIDPDWVLGALGWAVLVYIIVHFGGATT